MFNNFTLVLMKGLLVVQRFIMGATVIIFSMLVFIQVIIRYFLDIPLYGVEEIAVYLAVWLYFIGSGYGMYRGNHISANVLDLILKSERSRDISKVFVSLVSLFLIGCIFWLCLEYFQWSLRRSPKSPEFRLPLYYVHVSMVIGVGMMGFYGLIEFIRRFYFVVTGKNYVSLAEIEDIKLKSDTALGR